MTKEEAAKLAAEIKKLVPQDVPYVLALQYDDGTLIARHNLKSHDVHFMLLFAILDTFLDDAQKVGAAELDIKMLKNLLNGYAAAGSNGND